MLSKKDRFLIVSFGALLGGLFGVLFAGVLRALFDVLFSFSTSTNHTISITLFLIATLIGGWRAYNTGFRSKHWKSVLRLRFAATFAMLAYVLVSHILNVHIVLATLSALPAALYGWYVGRALERSSADLPSMS